MSLRSDRDLNPLAQPILRILREHPLGISEHALIQALQREQVFPELSSEPQLALFQRHFLVMNALYRLRERLWAEEQLTLEINPLAIVLRGSVGHTAGRPLSVEDGKVDAALRNYYLDWNHWRQTTAEDVAALLADFWHRHAGLEQRSEALAVLALPADADWPAIQRRYRECASRHHPDRGGDSAQFLLVREAYEVLRKGTEHLPAGKCPP